MQLPSHPDLLLAPQTEERECLGFDKHVGRGQSCWTRLQYFAKTGVHYLGWIPIHTAEHLRDRVVGRFCPEVLFLANGNGTIIYSHNKSKTRLQLG